MVELLGNDFGCGLHFDWLPHDLPDLEWLVGLGEAKRLGRADADQISDKSREISSPALHRQRIAKCFAT